MSRNPFTQDEANRKALWRTVSEEKFRVQVKQLLQANRWEVYHTYNSLNSDPGFPDNVMVRNNRVVYAELKRYGEELTPDQLKWKNLLERANQEYYEWDISKWDEIVEVLT